MSRNVSSMTLWETLKKLTDSINTFWSNWMTPGTYKTTQKEGMQQFEFGGCYGKCNILSSEFHRQDVCICWKHFHAVVCTFCNHAAACMGMCQSVKFRKSSFYLLLNVLACSPCILHKDPCTVMYIDQVLFLQSRKGSSKVAGAWDRVGRPGCIETSKSDRVCICSHFVVIPWLPQISLATGRTGAICR